MKRPTCLKVAARIRNQIFKAYFDVLAGVGKPVGSAAAHHPFPVQSRDTQGSTSVPWERPHPSLLVGRNRAVPSIPDHVYEEGIGNRPLDFFDVQHMGRRSFNPSFRTLDAGDAVHQPGEEIARIHALAQSAPDMSLDIDPWDLSQRPLQELPHERLLISGPLKVWKPRRDGVEVGLFPIDGESPRRDEHRVQQCRS